MAERPPVMVIAYDGSNEARDAAATAARLIGGRATVVHVRSPATAVPASAERPVLVVPARSSSG